MSLYQSLLDTFRTQLEGNFARLKCLTDAVFALTSARSVNLIHISTHSHTKAKLDSHHRRLQRFFSEWKMPRKSITKLILRKIPKPKNGYILSIDRTNWQFGQTHINILTIGVIINKIAVPLVWRTLPQASKRGNSHTIHRMELMSELLQILPAEQIDYIAMDREFHGKKWLKFLEQNDLTFVLRIKANTLINGKAIRDYQRSPRACKTIWGLQLYVGIKQVNSQRTQDLYVVSNRFQSIKALNAYKKRWGIEVVFGHFKRKGFNIEDTHLREAERIDRLVAVVTLSFFYCFGWGILLKHAAKKTSKLFRKSHFRLGLEDLARTLKSPQTYIHHSLTQWLSNLSIPKIFVV
jgi:hypothetical protein